jgi:hypothetical protein
VQRDIKPVTGAHLRAVKEKDSSGQGLLLRAEYCDFMSKSAASIHEAEIWAYAGNKRLAESTRGA